MSLWGRVFAAVYDPFLRGSEEHGVGALRADLLADLAGRVLEVGAGTGANLAHYPPGLAELVLTEPEPPMARRLEHRGRAGGRPVRVVRAPAEALPFADGGFDAVVATLVLCTVPDVGRALAEIRRVLRPGGELRFLEHVRHDDPARARRQARLTPIQRRVACGCHLDRPTPELIAAAGLRVTAVRRTSFPRAPSFLQPLAVGTARA